MGGIISLDYQNRTPIYEQIVNEVERYVALGILRPQEQIPSIRELASDLGVNPNTVKKAYSELENKGIILTISTKGTFISENIAGVVEAKIERGIYDIRARMDEIVKLGVSREELLERLK